MIKEKLKERLKKLCGNSAEYKKLIDSFQKALLPSVRVNTIKTDFKELKKKLEKRWKIEEIGKKEKIGFIIKDAKPGEVGKAIEHQIGFYYVQTIASMLPSLVLSPKPGEKVLDMCAAPGSKTTHLAALMKNKGLLVANDKKIDRIKALVSNIERCGVMNCIVTMHNALEKKFDFPFLFDKVLVDAPCSGLGTAMQEPYVLKMWNPRMVEKLSRLQLKLLKKACDMVKDEGIIVYSTCTLEVLENEDVIRRLIEEEEKKIKVEKIPFFDFINCDGGIEQFEGFSYDFAKNCIRIWPHRVSPRTEGFFIAKIKVKK